MKSEQVGFLFVWLMEIHMSSVRICITFSSLTIGIDMSREGQDTIKRFNHDIYMSREGQDTNNRFNHGDVYIKRGLVSHYTV